MGGRTLNKIIVMTVGAGLFLAGNALAANNVHVMPGNTNHPTITAAVAAVPVGATATLTISAGIYPETDIVVDGKNITFTGAGSSSTVIGTTGNAIFDTRGSHAGEHLTFNKLTITKGQAGIGSPHFGVGAGLRLTDGARANLNDCFITNCVAAAGGGGIYIQGSSTPPCRATLNNCSIGGCQAPAGGGSAINNASTDATALRLTNCNITGNVAAPQIAGPHTGENLVIGPKKGDMDEDGDVDHHDILLSHHEAGLCHHDNDGDGSTGINDLLNVIDGWGQSCTP